jgi:DNA repair exonuclease SbcCD ATPase subunit
MMNILFKKTILAASVAVLALAALPVTNAFASDENPPRGDVSNEKLEQAWARQIKNYERMGKAFENTDTQISKIQALIDKAAANGKDVSAIQAALDAFEAALKNARPTYEAIKAIVNSHQGFDENGKVTDAELAKSTVQGMHARMQEIKTTMNGTGKALREAIKAFREANRPANAPDRKHS